MKQITLNIPEDQFPFFMKLVQSLNFVEVADEPDLIVSEDTYDPNFISKIRQSQQEFEEGDFTRVKKEDLKEFLGL